MAKLLRINLKTAAQKGFNPRRYCLDNDLMGVGWRVDSEEPLDWPSYLEMAGAKYGRSKGKKRYASVIQLHDKVQKGDLCWTRDQKGNYYLGVVESDWFYDAGETNRQYDMVNLRRCRWSPKLAVDRVPGKVVNSFVGRRPTLQSISEHSAVTYSFNLANKANVLGTDYPVHLNSSRLLELISFDDCEDLVGIYLQSQGYFLVPSSCKKSTVGYEFLLQHRETGSTAVAQVKKGKVDLNQTHFEPSKLAVGKAFLFTTQGHYLGQPNEKVVCLSPDALTDFAQKHADWMPYRIRFWMDQLAQNNEEIHLCKEEVE